MARGFREDDGEGLRGGLARNLRLTFQEPDFLVLPSLQKPTHTKNEISRGVMGAAGGGGKGDTDWPRPSTFVPTGFLRGSAFPDPRLAQNPNTNTVAPGGSQHGTQIHHSLRGRSPGWIPIQVEWVPPTPWHHNAMGLIFFFFFHFSVSTQVKRGHTQSDYSNATAEIGGRGNSQRKGPSSPFPTDLTLKCWFTQRPPSSSFLY